MIVTIDGPVASGKTSVACAVAAELSWFCLLSGYLYRAVTYGLYHHYAYDSTHPQHILEKDVTTIIDKLTYEYGNNGVALLFDHQNITSLLKNPTIDQMVSHVSKLPFVRHHLVTLQRHLVQRHHNAIAEGRDCGTTVFPHAELKIFLTAQPAVRGQRWQHDQEKNGIYLSQKECLQFIIDRDTRDSQRTCSPLAVPPDAVIIDSSEKDLHETVQTVLSAITKRMPADAT